MLTARNGSKAQQLRETLLDHQRWVRDRSRRAGRRADLSYADLSKMSLAGLTLEAAKLVGARLVGNKLAKADRVRMDA